MNRVPWTIITVNLLNGETRKRNVNAPVNINGSYYCDSSKDWVSESTRKEFVVAAIRGSHASCTEAFNYPGVNNGSYVS